MSKTIDKIDVAPAKEQSKGEELSSKLWDEMKGKMLKDKAAMGLDGQENSHSNAVIKKEMEGIKKEDNLDGGEKKKYVPEENEGKPIIKDIIKDGGIKKPLDLDGGIKKPFDYPGKPVKPGFDDPGCEKGAYIEIEPLEYK